MKGRILFVVSLLALLLLIASAAWSQVRIDGVYGELEEPSHIIMYAQDGNTIHAIGYWVRNGSPCVWLGLGTRNGNTISYSLKYTFGSPTYTATHTLTISADGQRLTGTWSTSDGRSGSTTIVKK